MFRGSSSIELLHGYSHDVPICINHAGNEASSSHSNDDTLSYIKDVASKSRYNLPNEEEHMNILGLENPSKIRKIMIKFQT